MAHLNSMFLTVFLVCATLFAPSLASLVVPNQLSASPSSITIPKFFDVDAAVAEVVANHVNAPESAPSPASDSQGLGFPVIAVNRDGMPHPMADSRLLTGLLSIVHADMSNVEEELSTTNPTGSANLCVDKHDGFHVDPTASIPCSSFITCHYGNMSGPTPCPKGHLFDSNSTVCGPHQYVKCAPFPIPTTPSPHKKEWHSKTVFGRHRKFFYSTPSNLVVTPQPIVRVGELNATTCALEDKTGCNYCNLLTYAPKESWVAIGGIKSYSDICANLTALEHSVPTMNEVTTNVYDLCVAMKMGDYALVKFRQFAVRFKACTMLAPKSFDDVYKCIEAEQKAVCLPKTLALLKTMRMTIGGNQGYGYHSAACACTWKNAVARFSRAATQFQYYCDLHFLRG